jgi:hypothetical protein
MKLKFTPVGRQVSKMIKSRKALEEERKAIEMERKAIEMERWAAKEARLKHERAALKYEVKRRWAEYDRRKDAKIKEEIARIIQQAEDEGVQLVSP